jgi:hypothetical protein
MVNWDCLRTIRARRVDASGSTRHHRFSGVARGNPLIAGGNTSRRGWRATVFVDRCPSAIYRLALTDATGETQMPRLARSAIGMTLFALLAAGCSQGNAPASPNATGAAPAASSAQSAATGTSSPAESTGTGARAGASSKWCLDTNDEVTAAFGQAITTATGADVPGSGGSCIYTAGSNPILAISVVQPAPPGIMSGLLGGQMFKQLSGIGDAAALASHIGPLALQKGNTVVLLTIMPGLDTSDDSKMQSALEQLAKAAVARIP